MTNTLTSPRAALLLLWLVISLPFPSESRAAEITEETSSMLGLAGSFKAVNALETLRQENLYQASLVPFAEQRVRVEATYSRDWLRLQLANQLDFFEQSFPGAKAPLTIMSPRNAWNANWHLVNGARTDVYDRLDIAQAQISTESLDVVIGKQTIATGVGHIFNAVSQVPRYSTLIVDSEYPVTQDALSVIWRTGGPVLEARFLPKLPDEQGPDFFLRAKHTLAEVDTGITLGRSDDKPYAGLEAAANVGDSVLRGEVVGYSNQGRAVMQALAGFDRVLNARWSTQWELFYNGFGTRKVSAWIPSSHASTLYRGQWYLGSMVTWDMEARLKATLLSLVNLTDPSGQLGLSATYSLASSLDLVVGQILNIASSPSSEFGGLQGNPLLPVLKIGAPDMTYAMVKYAF